MGDYGLLSLVPVATILIVAITTKKTLFAMICGTITGSLILAGGLTGFVDAWFTYLYASMSDETLQWLCIVIAMFGILIVLFERSNAVKDFGLWARQYVKTEKQAMITTFVLGIIVFLDDYLNNLAVSTTMKGITDEFKIPRTRLGYIVNSVAAPVCVLIPLSSWAVYYSVLLEDQGVLVDGSGMGAYIAALPLTFYPWIALIVALLSIFGIIPKLGVIKKDSLRAAETGNVFPEDSDITMADTKEDEVLDYKPMPFNFLIPLIVMIIVTILTGTDVLLGSMAGVFAAYVFYGAQRKLNFENLLTATYDGVVSMSFVVILSILAFAVQKINLDLALADYVIAITLPIMKGAFLPAVVFIVCAIYAYTTGCFWDLAAIIVPIVIPLALAMEVDPILAAAAIFSGTAFGSNTCLYGDGVILCSQGVEVKSVQLMMATLPYACIAGGISVILYLIAGFVM